MNDGQPKTGKKPNPTDIYVGSRIRMRRKMLGLSQEKLGEKLGITFQQIQKYEKGANRVSSSRLVQIGSVLKATPSYFFKDAPGSNGDNNTADTVAALAYAKFIDQGGMKLMEHWALMTTAERSALGEIARNFAARAKR